MTIAAAYHPVNSPCRGGILYNKLKTPVLAALPSMKFLKASIFGRVLSSFAPVSAAPSAPGGLARWPARDSPWVRPGPTARGFPLYSLLPANCQLPTGYCYLPQSQAPMRPAASPGSPSPRASRRPAAACRGGCPPRCGAPVTGPGPSLWLSCCSRGGRCSYGRGC